MPELGRVKGRSRGTFPGMFFEASAKGRTLTKKTSSGTCSPVTDTPHPQSDSGSSPGRSELTEVITARLRG
ncbi:hypothetical protein AB1N83_014190 [Pleurotus pulmonarius]